MKIKLRPEPPSESGPTEWSEMNDWLADLKAMADEEQATPSFGPANAAKPRDSAEDRDEVQPLSAAVPEDNDAVAPPATTSWTENDPAPAPGSHQAYGISETYGAPTVAANDEADVAPAPEVAAETAVTPEAHGSGAYPITGGSGAYPVTGNSGAYPVTGGSGAYAVTGGWGAYPTADGSGAYPIADPYGGPDAGLASGLDGAGVADVAGPVAEPEPYGAPSELAAGLLDNPGADAAHGAGVTSASASAVTPAPSAADVPPVASAAPATPVSPALRVPPATWAAPATWMPSATPAPPATRVPPATEVPPATGVPPATLAPRVAPVAPMAPVPPVTPATGMPVTVRRTAAAPVARPESTPVPALIGDELRTPMVWCELEPGHCVSWHADRAALGMADVRARAIAAGWRIDALGRLTCPQCQQRSTTFRATQQVVLWDRAYALTMAAREAARQGGYAYPQPAFYPR